MDSQADHHHSFHRNASDCIFEGYTESGVRVDEPSDLKADSSPNMDNEMTAKERGVLGEDNEKEELDQERSQEDEGEERKLREEEGEGEGLEKRRKEQELLTEEQELEELKAQVLQLLVELEEAREMSYKHQESFHELQGERSSLDEETDSTLKLH
ncbi:hypothetical protein ILYODFUR_026196 [Ilyodon furcidens]|uniref:Uncharacterized protein n=1 Tax=Ilyodon furcidens TaxID=33524 RepID=A0ABV0TB84_9TELE